MSNRTNVRVKVYHYLFELVVIVSGITVSFLLNEWRLDRDGRESLRRDLMALEISLATDRTELLELIERRQEVEPSMRLLMERARVDGAGDEDLESLFAEMLDGAAFCFYPDSGAWRALVASGNLRLIRDVALQSALFDFYDHAVPRIADNNRLADEVLVTGLLAWLAGEFPVREGGTRTMGPLQLTPDNRAEFRRQVGRALPHTSWYQELLQQTLGQLERALQAVRGHLELG